jgi:hypothetical protein
MILRVVFCDNIESMSTKAEVLWQWVDERCAHLGIDSIRELERRSGVSYGAISRPKGELRLPTVDLALKMCKPLVVDFVEFWANSGIITIDRPSGYAADIVKLLKNQDDETLRQIYFLVDAALKMKNK